MQTGKIRRQFRAEPQDFMGNGVFDVKYMGMQSLSAKGRQRRLSRSRQQRRLGSEARSISIVPQQRVADRSQMHPNLMGSPGFQPAIEEAR